MILTTERNRILGEVQDLRIVLGTVSKGERSRLNSIFCRFLLVASKMAGHWVFTNPEIYDCMNEMYDLIPEERNCQVTLKAVRQSRMGCVAPGADRQ